MIKCRDLGKGDEEGEHLLSSPGDLAHRADLGVGLENVDIVLC